MPCPISHNPLPLFQEPMLIYCPPHLVYISSIATPPIVCLYLWPSFLHFFLKLNFFLLCALLSPCSRSTFTYILSLNPFLLHPEHLFQLCSVSYIISFFSYMYLCIPFLLLNTYRLMLQWGGAACHSSCTFIMFASQHQRRQESCCLPLASRRHLVK